MKSVLIIDDDEVDFMIYSRVIKLGNYAERFVYKSSGESGLEYLKSIKISSDEWPTFILVDINMPGMNGFNFIEIYSQLFSQSSESTKIFMVSSSDDSRDKEKAKSFKIVNGFFTKPLTIDLAKEIFG